MDSLGRVLLIGQILNSVPRDKYSESISFSYHNASGHPIFTYYPLRNEHFPFDTNCNPDGKYAIIVSGWRTSCDKNFVQDLIKSEVKMINFYKS